MFFLFFFYFAAQSSCSFPGSPAHSSVEFSEDTDGVTTATYTCERGFELLGPARRRCENGQWTPDGIPFCGKHSSNYTHALNVFFFIETEKINR